MKPKYLVLLIAIVLIGGLISRSYGNSSETFTTGKEWVERMSKKEKFLSIFAPYILYYRYGVPFKKKPQEYIADVDRILLYNPYWENEDIANIFASTVYALEPGTRPALRAMAADFRYHRLNDGEVSYPRLLLSPQSSSGRGTQNSPAE